MSDKADLQDFLAHVRQHKIGVIVDDKEEGFICEWNGCWVAFSKHHTADDHKNLLHKVCEHKYDAMYFIAQACAAPEGPVH